jgi:hypothetical protein
LYSANLLICSSATIATDQAGSTQSGGLNSARRIDALLDGIGALLEQAVEGVMCAHDVSVVDLLWVRRENAKIEGREIVCRREALLLACDPAPSWSQTPTTGALNANDGAKRIIVRKMFGVQL